MDFLVMCRVGVEWTLNTVTVGVFVWWHLMNDRKALLNIHAHMTIWAHISSPIFSKSSLKAIQDSFSTPGNKEREICQGNVWAMCKQWGCWRGPSSTRLMTEHSCDIADELEVMVLSKPVRKSCWVRNWASVSWGSGSQCEGAKLFVIQYSWQVIYLIQISFMPFCLDFIFNRLTNIVHTLWSLFFMQRYGMMMLSNRFPLLKRSFFVCVVFKDKVVVDTALPPSLE